MSFAVEGKNSELMKEIMSDPRLLDIFTQYALSSDADKEFFKFVRYQDTGRLDIIDTRKKNEPISTKIANSNKKIKTNIFY